MNQAYVVSGATLIDGTESEPVEGVSIVIAEGVIQEIHTDGRVPNSSGHRIDCSGRTLMPGLIDAHVHIGAVSVDVVHQTAAYPSSLIALMMAKRLRKFLDLGYTTVRDCGGTDWGFKQAVEQGLIPGPRIIISNGILSQTGGHADFRTRAQTGDLCGQDAHFGIVNVIADGISEVRRAVREQVRLGADFIKVMASGGAASPNDKLDHAQYSAEELRVMVDEAQMAGVYVAAHALPAIAIEQAVRSGVRTIEHGNFLTDSVATLMADRGTYLIPTVSAYILSSRHPERSHLTPEMRDKISSAAQAAMGSLEIAARNGVRMGSGSDLLGDDISWLNRELEFKAEVLGAATSLRMATGGNAEVLGRDDIGVIAPGRRADLVAVEGDPLTDISILGDVSTIHLVMKDGEVHRSDL